MDPTGGAGHDPPSAAEEAGVRRWFAVVSVVAVLAGCGGDDGGGTADEAVTAGTDEPAVTTTTAPPEDLLREVVVTEEEAAGLDLELDEQGPQTQDEYYPLTSFGGPEVANAFAAAGFVVAYERTFGDINVVPPAGYSFLGSRIAQVEDESAIQPVVEALLAGAREANEVGAGGVLGDLSEVDIGDGGQIYTVTYDHFEPAAVGSLLYWRSGPFVLSTNVLAGTQAPEPSLTVIEMAEVVQARLDELTGGG